MSTILLSSMLLYSSLSYKRRIPHSDIQSVSRTLSFCIILSIVFNDVKDCILYRAKNLNIFYEALILLFHECLSSAETLVGKLILVELRKKKRASSIKD